MPRHPLTSPRLAFAEIVKVIVGTAPNQLEFTFYYKVVAKRSGFFRKCERSTEEESTLAVFHDHDPSTFDLYLECLYDNAVPKRSRPKVIRELEKKLYPPGLTEEEKEQYYTGNAKFRSARCKELVDLYILADHLMDQLFQPGLDDGRDASLEERDFARVFIDAQDLVPLPRQAGSRDASYIA